jgi:hypothetical protein
MTTDPRTIDTTSAGQDKAHLSTAEAKDSARDDNDQQLKNFIAALGMRRPVDTDKAARLLEHVIKEAMSASIDWLEGQMRTDGWESSLSNGETLTGVATRANAYLESPEGLELFNLFTKTFARTTGEIFD